MSQPSLLIVDDEVGVRESLRIIFAKDFRIFEATSSGEALRKTQEERPDIVLLDILMPGTNGLEILKQMKDLHPDCEVIMLTALNTARSAFTAKETGAFDYVTKPFDLDELRLRVDRAMEKNNLSRELRTLREEMGRKFGVENIVGKSKPMLDLFKTISMVANRKSTVLITGESGTGKELVARAIHSNSDRRGKPFVVVNCAALPDTLIESELFGHERGAFTHAYQRKIGRFELAHNGTIFLDEIGELGQGTQAKLLRAIETETFTRLGGTDEIKVNVRVLAATNRNVEKAIQSGEFRTDLFYRLNVVSVAIPPLVERREDIPLLLAHFLKLKAEEASVRPKILSPEVVDRFMSYSWPGNVRELENLVERLTVLSPNDTITTKDISEAMVDNVHTSYLREKALKDTRGLSEAVDEFERELILSALKKTGFNQTKAANLLGTTRRILRYRMEKLQIREEDLAHAVTKVSG
jgi:DNA-binding NtrC family response regulator